MFEETNQQVESFEGELPENLFEDEDEAFTMQESEGGMQNEAESEGSEPESVKSSEAGEKVGENHAEENLKGEGTTLRIKYNGEEKDISLEEARTLAQKGMNYDHVVQERDRNRNAFDFLTERAKAQGITVEQLIERDRERAENQRLEAKMDELRERDDDASEETIKSLAKFSLEAERKQEEQKRAEALEEKNKAEIEGWSRLFREHPELIAEDGQAKVTQGVFDLVKAGHSPIEAYYIERNRELEKQNKIISGSNAAKEKSIGSLSGVQNSDEDDFLAGFGDE